MIIKSRFIGEAWIDSCKEIIKNGDIVLDENERLKELLNLTIEVSRPLTNDSIIENYGSKEMISFMISNFLEKEPVLNWGYSYGSRIFDYNGINQMKEIIKKLQGNSYSKSATISLMFAPEDKHHIPCVCIIDFKIRNKKLITTAFLRSQDIGKKMYADAISITKLSKNIIDELKLNDIELVLHIASAHIYEKDIYQIDKILSEVKI